MFDAEMDAMDAEIRKQAAEIERLREQFQMTKEVERLRTALQAIVDHQDIVGGTIAHLSTTRHIAANALAADAAGGE